MKSRMYRTIYLLVLVITASTSGAATCEPAEEGKPYEFEFTTANLPKETHMVMWTKDDILVAECPVETVDCINNDMNWLTARVEKKNELVTFYMHISNVSRVISHNAKGFWKLRTHTSSPNVEVFYHCNLQIYTKPKDISCDFKWLTDSLNVECKVTRLFPEAMMIVHKTNTEFGPFSCVNHRFPEEIAYYNATCSTQFLHQQLHLKTNLFQFFIYPNIIAFNGNRNIGINASATLYSVPTDVVMKQCEINTEKINCSCKSLDKKVSQFDWFVNNSKVDNKHNIYVTSIRESAEQDIACKPLIVSECEKDCDNSAVIAVAVLLMITVVILILCLVYIKRINRESSRHNCVSIWNIIRKRAHQYNVEECSPEAPQTEITAEKCDAATPLLQTENTINKNVGENTKGEYTPEAPQTEITAEQSEVAKSSFQPENTFTESARQDPIGESSVVVPVTETTTEKDESLTDQEKGKSQITEPENPICLGGSGDQSIQTKNELPKTLLEVTTTILLIGTRCSNKELLKRSILQREYTFKRVYSIGLSKLDVKQIIDAKNQEKIFENPIPRLGDLPNFSLPDDEKIQLHYTKRDDQVIKLVDGPVYDTNNINKFIEDMKSCLTLTHEGFNAIIVAFTPDKTKDCSLIIGTLHDYFCLDMNCVFSVKICQNKTLKVKEADRDYQTIRKICGERLIIYNIEEHTDAVKQLMTLVSQTKQTCTSHLLLTNKEHLIQNSDLEEILKEMCLLLEIISDESQQMNDENKERVDEIVSGESQQMNDENKERVDHLVMLWGKYQENYGVKDDEKDNEELVRAKVNDNHHFKLDTHVQEDITHVIECLRHIYFVPEPMTRCKLMLMESLKSSYQNFNDWYVMFVIKDTENLLDSNLEMRLSKAMSKPQILTFFKTK